jgi:hypothetical protein
MPGRVWRKKPEEAARMPPGVDSALARLAEAEESEDETPDDRHGLDSLP